MEVTDEMVERAWYVLGHEVVNVKEPIRIGILTDEKRDELRRITRAVLEAALSPTETKGVSE